MKKKILTCASLLFVGMFLLTSCKPLRAEEKKTDTWDAILTEWKQKAPNELGEHVKAEISDTYQIDADIVTLNKLDSYEVETVRIKRHIYEDVENTLKKLLEYYGETVSSEISATECGNLLETEDMMYMASIDFGEENQSWAQVRSVYAILDTPFSNNFGMWGLDKMLQIQQHGTIKYEEMTVQADKEILSENKILQMKDALGDILEVEFMDEYIAYIYTEERLQDALEYGINYTLDHGFEINEEERWEVTEADEGVVLSFQQGYEEIPLFYSDPLNNVTGASWQVSNYCTVISSKEGIEGLQIMNPYDFLGTEESVNILTFGEFIEKHIALCKGVDTKVVEVALYYLPIYTGEELEFVAKPIWCVQTEEEDEFGYQYRLTTIYDAVTGEEIPW